MTVYTGFQSGTYQAWALNVYQNALGQPGPARAVGVTPSSTPGMSVVVTTDPVKGDGIAFLANGGWVRIDQPVTLTVGNNASGQTRNDAVVAIVDPTGSTTSGIYYLQGWGTSWKGANDNEVVLAQVQVPNNATSIISSNIVQAPLVATVGGAPLNYPDAVVGSEHTDPHGSQPGVFVAVEVQLTSAATNGQTSFTIPLTSLQRLVPPGRIGGALEVGDFAGPNGWYWPKLRGSVSGLLPLANVDTVNGILTSATGAQAGEAVYVSFKYYDFGRDARVLSGTVFIEKTSPYLVYQGEVVEDRQLGLAQPLYDGTQSAYFLLNSGDSVFYTDYIAAHVQASHLGGPGSTTNTVQVYMDGTLQNSVSRSGAGLPPGQSYQYSRATYTPATVGKPVVTQMKLVSGILAMAGVHNLVIGATSLYISGGVVTIGGQAVYLQSTSFQLPTATNGYQDSYVIYADRNGNITSSGGGAAATMDRVLGRVPLASALLYGTAVGGSNLSSSFGQWALPDSYLGWPVEVVVTNNNSAAPGTSMTSGWSMVADPLSPHAAYLVGYSANDIFMASAVCTGMDLLCRTSGVTAKYSVYVDDPSLTQGTTVFVGGTTQYNVRVTLFSGLPYGSHTVKLANWTSGSQLGFDALDVRVPATPAPPQGTVALAQVDVFGFSSILRPSIMRGTQIGSSGNSALYLLDAYRPSAAPAVWLANLSTSNTEFVLNTVGNLPAIHYQAGPDKGQLVWSTGATSGVIDCYAAGVVTDTVAPLPVGTGNVYTLSVSSSLTKNPSSSGFGIVLNAVDYSAWPAVVTNLRHFGLGHGHASELRASSLQTAQGGRLDDGGQGIRTEQVRDRSITSRKIAPVWGRHVTQTAWSGIGVNYTADPFQSLSITVEVPSILLINLNGSIHLPANTGLQGYVAVDGVNVNTNSTGANLFTVSNVASATMAGSYGTSYMHPVAAGTHLLQPMYAVALFASPAPYFDALGSRELTALAFAL